MNHHPFEIKCIYCRAHVVTFFFPNPLSSLYLRSGGRAMSKAEPEKIWLNTSVSRPDEILFK